MHTVRRQIMNKKIAKAQQNGSALAKNITKTYFKLCSLWAVHTRVLKKSLEYVPLKLWYTALLLHKYFI